MYMASIAHNKGNDAMADQQLARRDDDDDEPRRSSGGAPPPRTDSKEAGHGFFTVYKSGQGYWTRMLTAAGAAVLAALTISFLYTNLPPALTAAFNNGEKLTDPTAKVQAAAHAATLARNITWAICGGFLIGFSLIAWKVLNKPFNADFLIATDSEMKKVNWTSQKELWGSTKVVIFFMFLMAFLLFVTDVFFAQFFKFITVLKQGYF
jgi:preprotein translocase SecE subunit